MTDNDWIKQLQSMMERHEEPVSDDMWQEIEARLPEQQTPRRPLPAWLRYAAAAAVALAVIGTGGLLWHSSDSTETAVPEQPGLALTEEDNAPEFIVEDNVEDKAASDKKSVLSNSSSPIAHHATSSAQHQSADRPTESTQPTSTSETTTTEVPVQTTDRDTTTAKPNAPRLPITTKEEPSYASATPSRTSTPSRKNRPVSVGFFAVNKFPNLKGNNSQEKYFGSVSDPSLPTHYSNDSIPQGGEDGAAMQQGRLYAPLKANSNHATHHAPYSLGMSVSVPLTDRLALTSGIVYTRLKSDFSSGNGNREQTLHYLGIPLGVTYSVWQWRFVNLYAIGGMQADFNIKATLKEPTRASDINIDKDRVQFSGMLGPGLQFNVTRDFGIYVEPTARYYFNNGSTIENYFKDKPWNINLNAGLRLTIE